MIFRSRDVLERLNQRPFTPFRIHTTAGRVHEIRHPELAMVSPSFVLIGQPPQPYALPGAIDRFIEVALMHIAEIEPVAGEASPPQTGSGAALPAQ
jgi:hypothetical protein